jgi:hypothetical protein
MDDRDTLTERRWTWAVIAVGAYGLVAMIVLVATHGRVVLLRPW